jgi:hypothetical protein
LRWVLEVLSPKFQVWASASPSGSLEFDANRTESFTEGEVGLKLKSAVGARVVTTTVAVAVAWLSSSSVLVARMLTV